MYLHLQLNLLNFIIEIESAYHHVQTEIHVGILLIVNLEIVVVFGLLRNVENAAKIAIAQQDKIASKFTFSLIYQCIKKELLF